MTKNATLLSGIFSFTSVVFEHLYVYLSWK